MIPIPSSFIWAGGIEDTFIPQGRPGLRPLEEYELTQHYDQWRDDLRRAASLGIQMLRWGVPWYRVEPRQGQFDWSWTDEVLPFMVRELGIQPIVDLMHYGTPLWLERSFDDPSYPALVAAYQRAFAARYRGLVRYYTPLNEPTVNADFCGRRGEWPPYLSGEAGYMRVLLQLARGVQLSASSIRAADPDAVLVAVEAMGWCRASSEAARPAAERRDRGELLAWDLYTGLVDERHPLYSSLLEHSASAAELEQLRAWGVKHDIFGVNFYPWSACEVQMGADGAVRTLPVPRDGRLLADVLRRCHAHTGLPLMVTETSAKEPVEGRAAWMDETLAAVRQVRAEGVPAIGYTWFPLITMVDWAYRTSELPVERHLLHLGLWDSAFDAQGVLVRHETPLVAKYRAAVARTAEVVGPGVGAGEGEVLP
ncbi:MAG TPA: family 1 glycosylhydrolase [Roseiflexaceae bacterium]|nr:family 1 glycosylhydrolase [Roseiflexaceae bacterium]